MYWHMSKGASIPYRLGQRNSRALKVTDQPAVEQRVIFKAVLKNRCYLVKMVKTAFPVQDLSS